MLKIFKEFDWARPGSAQLKILKYIMFQNRQILCFDLFRKLKNKND